MKQLITTLSVVLLAGIIWAGVAPQNESETNIKTLYTNSCAGCHGDNLEKFKTYKWANGLNTTQIANTIKTGNAELGMPAFSAGLNDGQIRGLATLIVEEMNNRDTKLSSVAPSKTYPVDTIFSGIEVPWGMAFLPNDDLLVTERSGKLYCRKPSGKIVEVDGVPDVLQLGQGGLLDIKLHPDFNKNHKLFIAYSHRNADPPKGGNTSIISAIYKNEKLTQVKEIFRAQPDTKTGPHWGCRITFGVDNTLFFGVGERGTGTNAQTLSNHCGKIHHINEDGSIPKDNPFINTPGAMPSIWSYGHRNPQGLIFDKTTGILWEHEHGPRGGDELNIIHKGANYGWPVISFGINYDGTVLTNDTARAGMEQPITYWVPSIAPCGLTIVTGNKYPGWEGDFLIGSLRFKYLERVKLRNGKVVEREKLLENIGRLRNVEMGADGYIYVAVEKPGAILRLLPQ